MKNLFFITFIITVFLSCNTDNDYVTFSGEIVNSKVDSLLIFHPKRNFTKIIKINKNGTFKDTIKVENGLFSLASNNDFALLYLINGDDIQMTYDANNFEGSIQFTGDHTLENNFLAISTVNENKFFSDADLMFLPKATFDDRVANYITSFNNRLKETTLDKEFLEYQKKEIVSFESYINKDYLEKNYNKLVLGKGKPSPQFINYENYKGGDVSLLDLKGKYVYIDLWATWCPPCKAEIPFLEKIEKEYHAKNIEFVSISLDDKGGYEAWRKMVSDKNLGGLQLYAKGDKSFTSAFRVRSIPRFILLDKEGNIIEANAPRPSSSRLNQLLEGLDL